MSDMADVEGGSLRRVLETFGVEWSGLILLSTLALGFLGLDQYVSLTYWLLGSILALVIVYALQDSISPRFLPTFVVASSVAGLLIGGAFAAFAAFDHLAPAQLLHSADWSRWMTLYLSLTVFGSLGWTILSYKKRPPIPPDLPVEFQRSIKRNMSAYSVYRIDHEMCLYPAANGSEVDIRWINSYTLCNPTSADVKYTVTVTSHNCKMQLVRVTIDGSDQSVDASHLTELGWRFPVVVPGRGKLPVRHEVINTYRSTDSDTFATFYVPSTPLQIKLFRGQCPSIEFTVTKLANAVDPDVSDEIESYTIRGALPFQGFLVSWHPKGKGVTVINR